MKRSFCFLASFAVLFLPDGASACWPTWGRPVYPTPIYYQPLIYPAPAYPQVYQYPPVFQAMPATPLLPPKVDAIPKAAATTAPITNVSPSKLSNASTPPPPTIERVTDSGSSTKSPNVPPKNETPVKNETVQPARRNDSIISPVVPQSANEKSEDSASTPKAPSAPSKNEVTKPAANNDSIVSPVAPPKKPEILRVITGESTTVPMVTSPGNLPPLVLPKERENNSATQGKEAGSDKTTKPMPSAVPFPAPGDPLSNLPSATPRNSNPPLTLPGTTAPATPSPAPAGPDALLIPPPSLPLNPGTGKPDSLPSLTLPPDVPVSPASKTESKSHSSPITGTGNSGMTVDVFPVAALEKQVEGYRTVTFFNHTNREINLTIEGKAVKLPAKSYVESKLAQTFKWGYGERPVDREQVPDGAAGLDVVFRE